MKYLSKYWIIKTVLFIIFILLILLLLLNNKNKIVLNNDDAIENIKKVEKEIVEKEEVQEMDMKTYIERKILQKKYKNKTLNINNNEENNNEENNNEENILDNKENTREKNILDNIGNNNEENTREKNENIEWYISNIIINQNKFNSNISNLLEISWNNLELIKYVKIGEVKLNWVLRDWKYLVWIEKWVIKNNLEYNIILWLIDNIDLKTDIKISFIYSDSKINIANITPDKISNKEDTFLVLQWNWFKKIIQIQLSNNVIIKNTSFKVINDNVATIKINKWLETWEYFFNIMHTEGISELKSLKFEIIN